MKKRFILYSMTVAVMMLAGCGDESTSGVIPVCGNGLLEDGEKCDDGNMKSGDGCSSHCVVEEGWECPNAGKKCEKSDEPFTETSVCGNKKVEKNELCDDGNTKNGDGCSSECQIEDEWECPPTGGACTPKPKCGDGKVDKGEKCDDNNTEPNDGCSADCQIEPGWKCPVEGQPCASDKCGNGDLDDDEECDDGAENVAYGDGYCALNCRFAHYCGDGLWDDIDKKNGEECDAGGDTSADYEGCTQDCKRVNFCGDGKVTHTEYCDDGNDDSGDGCSSDCQQEPNYICKKVDEKSVCIAIKCGNGKVDENETCDDGNRISGDGCSASCHVEKAYTCTEGGDGKSQCTSTVGDGVINNGEQCDDGNQNSGDGCSDHGIVEPGYVCETMESGASNCYAKTCSDGIKAGTEECDDANDISGDGCSKQCKREHGYHCDTPGQPCELDHCGDGIVTGDETCDEGPNKTEGCDGKCQIVMGWKCEVPGQACSHDASCGNGILEGAEQCDESSECCNGCLIQPHCLCDSDGKNCAKGYCGNKIVEAYETCDDGNDVAGDGCSPVCEIEPIFDCNENGCKPTCGDGLVIEGQEDCDDGNLISGDGCSSQCKAEDGFQCVANSIALVQGSITLPIVYRDFIRYNGNTGAGDGYVSQAIYDSLPPSCKPGAGQYRYSSGGNYAVQVGRPSPDFYSYCPDSHCLDAVKPMLDTDGKPALNTHEAIAAAVSNKAGEGAYDGTDGSKCIWLYTCQDVFKWWYKDVPGINRRIDSTITLTEASCDASIKASGTFCYQNDSFYPINGQGYGNGASNGSQNGEFSSEFQTYFQYNGGEKLIFNGDDDVWVFFNNRLGVDVGGIHPQWNRSITLDEQTAADKFHMYKGGIYSLNMFHAERCTGGSSFRLSLAGFVPMGRSSCDSVCGDGIVRGNEQCDNGGGHVADDYAKMLGCVNCKLVPTCGNGKVEQGEVCDAGHLCKDSAVEGCTYNAAEEAAGCNTSCQNPNCNNGSLEPGEICDCKDNVCQFANSSDNGKSCLNCKISGCGDGIVDPASGEECDDGNLSNEDMCTTSCKAPYCGDGIVSVFLGEVCDDGKNDGSYGGCGLGCTYQPPYCGDGIVNEPHEVCDDGVNDGSYGGCMPGCKEAAPRCGDGIVQTEYGETCDPNDPNNKVSCGSSCHPEIN